MAIIYSQQLCSSCNIKRPECRTNANPGCCGNGHRAGVQDLRDSNGWAFGDVERLDWPTVIVGAVVVECPP